MARKEIHMEELVEVLHQWPLGRSVSQIHRSVGMSRKTIRKYLLLAEEQGFSRESDPGDYRYYLELSGKIQKGIKTPVASTPSFKKTVLFQGIIEKLMRKPYMTPKQVYQILKREYEFPLSYSSFNRYINVKYPKVRSHCLRIEVKAGEEAQVDFGSCGMLYDPESGKMRRAHIFLMTLSFSRFPYVEFVFDQGQVTWVKCHMNAFSFFGGVPSRVVLDNLKSGVLKANTYDPVFNWVYGECARFYGFIIDPAKVYQAKHKGKVERMIPVVRSQFVSSYDLRDIKEANEKVRKWCLSEYGDRVHGTTKKKPYELFLEKEKPHLLPLPGEKFDIPLWKEAKAHPDHHVVFDKSYYLSTHPVCGEKGMGEGRY